MDIRNAENAFATGKNNFHKFLEGFLAEWNAPIYRTQLALMLKAAPPGTIESLPKELKDRMKDEYDIDLLQNQESE